MTNQAKKHIRSYILIIFTILYWIVLCDITKLYIIYFVCLFVMFQWRRFNFFDINHNADSKKISQIIGVCNFLKCIINKL